ncbi:hypothetical protein KNHN1_17410 [Pseudomonas guariconensis]|uniref:hypothetical protein n=1 Tax=Pseudomonas guariconensis TaxID=1288410 RepID=UPI0036F27F81
MPTENRSSNTDPRDVFIRLNPLGLGEAELRKDSTGFEDPRTHSDYLLFLAGYRETQPAPQPHPEPIAWMVGTAIWWTKEEAERDAAETGLPIVGLGPMTGVAPTEQRHSEPAAWRGLNELGEVVTEWIDGVPPASMVDLCGNPASFASIERAYTHADPGEVERLRAEVKRLDLMVSQADHNYDMDRATFRRELAEREALIGPIAGWTAETRAAVLEAFQDELNESASYPWYDAAIADLMKLIEALSPSAEPSAAARNQCDGCQAGIPIVNGAHRMGRPGGYTDTMSCQASRYESAPVERDEWAAYDALRAFVGSAYPVSSSINERGHNWSEAYLDEALLLARAALERKPS